MCMQRATRGSFLAAVLILVGCDGDNLAVVKGTVRFEGKPIETGSIRFFPSDGATGTAAAEIKDGEYSARVPIGLMKVQINSSQIVGKKKLYDTPESPERPIYAELLPETIADREKTGLRFEVKSGVNQKDWDLKKP